MSDLATELVKYNHAHDEHGRFATSDRRAGAQDFGEVSPLYQRDEAEKYLKKEHDSWQRQLAGQETISVYKYTDHSFLEINQVARGHWGHLSELDKGDAEAHMRHLDKAIDKHSFSEDVVVYRGFGPKTTNKVAELPKGAELVDQGFVSTSLSPLVASTAGHHVHNETEAKSLVARIVVPQGAKAAPIDGSSAHNEELEVLLPRGSRFKVLGHEDAIVAGRKTRYVDMELVP